MAATDVRHRCTAVSLLARFYECKGIDNLSLSQGEIPIHEEEIPIRDRDCPICPYAARYGLPTTIAAGYSSSISSPVVSMTAAASPSAHCTIAQSGYSIRAVS